MFFSLLQLAYNSFLKIIKSSTGEGSIFKKVKFYPSELILCNSLYIKKTRYLMNKDGSEVNFPLEKSESLSSPVLHSLPSFPPTGPRARPAFHQKVQHALLQHTIKFSHIPRHSTSLLAYLKSSIHRPHQGYIAFKIQVDL